MDRAVIAVWPLLVVAGVASSGCGKFQAQYLVRPKKVPVGGYTVILKTDYFTLSDGATLLVNADGSCWADTGDAVGDLFIEIVDKAGTLVSPAPSSLAVVGWDGTKGPQQHSFNVMGAPHLDAGTYQVRLIAKPEKGAFTVAAWANLSVMQLHAKQIAQAVLESDSPQPDSANYNFETYDLPIWFCCQLAEPRVSPDPLSPVCPCAQPCLWNHTAAPVPPPQTSPIVLPPPPQHSTIVSVPAQFDGSTPWIVLASGRAYHAGNSTQKTTDMDVGDSMLGLFVDGKTCSNSQATWSINDFSPAADLQAPMSSQGFFTTLPCGSPPPNNAPGERASMHTISFDATKMPVTCYAENNRVKYKVGAGTRMVALSGGMTVSGSAPIGVDVNNPSEVIVIGLSGPGGIGVSPPPFPEDCPDDVRRVPCCKGMTHAIGCARPIASAKINIPQGHDGVVFFTARARNLGNQDGETGFYHLWIDVSNDAGSDVPSADCASSEGIQGVNGASQRTLSASLLTAGKCALKPGSYTATVLGEATGTIQTAALSAEVPLIWFDEGLPLTQPCGQPCGLCNTGTWDCSLKKCVGDHPTNSCGGCKTLAGPRNAGCTDGLPKGQCGRWTCTSPDVDVCTAYGVVNDCGGCTAWTPTGERHRLDPCTCGPSGSEGHVLVCSPQHTLVCCGCPNTPACH
jgi:hypothetical protein